MVLWLLGGEQGAKAADSFAPLRIATFNTELLRKGPGLLLRDIERGDPQVAAVISVITYASPDIVLLQGVDYDHSAHALRAIAGQLSEQREVYPYWFARRPNSGWQTGLDLDSDGRSGHPRDAQGYGVFAGQGGMAILSRFPFVEEAVQDFSSLLWRDAPGAHGPLHAAVLPPHLHEVQRLSSVAHWAVPVDTPMGRLTLLAFHATPPVFDGVEDRNGYRNADELRVWLAVLAGQLGSVPDGALVVIGDANNDPSHGEGQKQPLRQLLSHPRLQDPLAALGATVEWSNTGPMRVDYILPSRDLIVHDAGMSEAQPAASRHRLVWVDLIMP